MAPRDLTRAWWQGPFQVERACTCEGHNRSAECASDGWHCVDSWDTADEARADARACSTMYGHAYRAIERSTGKVV